MVYLTRAYFSAATCANSLILILSVYTPLKFFPIDVINKVDIIKKSVLNKKERDNLIINIYIRSILIGCVLSDGWMQLNHKNPRFGLKQSIINFPYFWHIYNLLSNYTNAKPHLGKTIKRNK